MTESGDLRRNAEARFRRGAHLAWRISVFLVAALAGGLVWRVFGRPVRDTFAAPLRPDLAETGGAMLRAALEVSPAILLACAACFTAGVLRRFAHGRAHGSGGAGVLTGIGIAVLLAGLMAIGAPPLLAMLETGAWAGLRADFDLTGLALIVLGGVAFAAGRALRDAG